MSRLEDELKTAFRRGPAPAGFSDKVMQRIASEQRERELRDFRSWWRSLRAWFGGTNVRLLQAAALALLLVAIIVIAYRMINVSPRQQIANSDEPTGTPQQAAPVVTPPPNVVKPEAPSPDGLQSPDGPHAPLIARYEGHGHRRPNRPRFEERPSSEAEVAKEQVMLALQVASSTLADAQRSVQEGEDYSRSK